MSEETKSERLYREGKIPYNQYTQMRLCEAVGQKGYKGHSCFIVRDK